MVKIIIDGMMCMHCVSHAKTALESIGTNVNVVLEGGIATLTTDAPDSLIKEVIEKAGYSVKSIER